MMLLSVLPLYRVSMGKFPHLVESHYRLEDYGKAVTGKHKISGCFAFSGGQAWVDSCIRSMAIVTG